MAQGNGKLGKAKKSGGSSKRLARRHQTYKGPRKIYNPKGKKGIEARGEMETSKTINRRNEAIVSAKALSSGTRFFLSDVKETGKKELSIQHKSRSKKENKDKRITDRLRTQLNKLDREA
mmetsp:Transcript_40688/g.46243  ORF Transcript_40688/g.46243 Transcript_40688/m.46243 type:complete len:120 (-) Transcript_40688:264-623(-)